MAAEQEIEELQLQLEFKVCCLGVDALAEVAEHLLVETTKAGTVNENSRENRARFRRGG